MRDLLVAAQAPLASSPSPSSPSSSSPSSDVKALHQRFIERFRELSLSEPTIVSPKRRVGAEAEATPCKKTRVARLQAAEGQTARKYVLA